MDINSLWRIVLTCSCFLLITFINLSCGKVDPLQPTQLNSPLEVKAGDSAELGPKPLIKLTLNKPDKLKFSQGEMIPYQVMVEVPEGGRMPEVIYVSALGRDLIASGPLEATPTKKEGRHAELRGEVEAPRQPGQFALEAEGLQTVFVDSADKLKPAELKTTRIKSNKIAIEVK